MTAESATHPDPAPPAAPAARGAALLSVKGLRVSLPGGAGIVEGVDLEIMPGQVVSLLGPSGAGKSTLVRAVLSPEELSDRGYAVAWDARDVRAEAAFVPQRGALLDHLDVAGNIALAQEANGRARDVAPWLAAVHLDESLGKKGRSVSALSGGQVQRIAVARTLAAGRKLLVLDEPSVGLDPLGVRALARFLMEEAREQGVGVLVITHDLVLAGGASDKIVFLDPATRSLTEVTGRGWAGPLERADAEDRVRRLAGLESTVEHMLAEARAAAPAHEVKAARDAGSMGAVRTAGSAIINAGRRKLFGASMGVMARAIVQGLLRPLAFYLLVGALLGFTVPYVIAHLTGDLSPASSLRIVGGTYVLALAPPLSAILFSATSGSAVNAWLGGLQLNRQVTALRGLGVSPERYLWSPAWVALAVSYALTALAFVSAMVFGGWLMFSLYKVPNALSVLTSDFLDPAPSRLPYLWRALWLVAVYSVSVASIVVSRGARPKDRTEEVTSAMTSSVIRCTVFVVAMELASVVVLFARTGGRA